MFARRPLIFGLALAQLSLEVAALAAEGSRPAPAAGSVSWLLRWNQIAIDASGLDHAGPHEQLGPGRSSRALAIVHIAIFDALNAAVGGYESYTGLGPVRSQPSLQLGIHWSFDKTEGITQGRAVADYVFEHAFQPVLPRAAKSP
jgi:hypothetical protein